MAELKRDIGVIGAAFIALNGIVGAGIFAMPQDLVVAAGAFSPYFILVIGVLMIAVAAVMGELAGYFDRTGGPVVYVSAAFGPFAGFQVGWLYYLARVGAFAANVNVLITYLSAYAPVDDGAVRISFIVALVVALAAINIAGVKGAIRTLGVVTVLKIAPLIVLAAWGLIAFAGAIPAPAPPENPGALGGVSLVLLYAFVGFEAATLTAGETRDAKRAVPRALIFIVLGMTAFYFLIQLAYVAIMQGRPPEGAPLAAAAAMLAGPWGAAAITLAAVVSIGGNLFATLLAAPRITFAMAEAGALPSWFGAVHSRFATPANSILAMGVLAGVLAGSGAFAWLAALSSLARLIVYFSCTASLPKHRGDAAKQERGPLDSITRMVAPVAAIALCVWAATQAKPEAWLFVGVFALVGAALYILTRWRRGAGGPM